MTSTEIARRDMLQVDVRAGVFGKDDVARDDEILGGVRPAAQSEARRHHAFVHHRALRHRVILAVVHHRQVEHLRVLDTRGA